MKDYRNLSLPLGSSANQDSPESAPGNFLAEGARRPPRPGRKVAKPQLHLPDVVYLFAVTDRDAGERNALLDVSAEAAGLAKVSMMVFEADRLCSWLTAPQRLVLCEHIRALNLLMLEAHFRASGLFPNGPGNLPLHRLCAHLLAWRRLLPFYLRRLGLLAAAPELPNPVPLGEHTPSRAIRADVDGALAELPATFA